MDIEPRSPRSSIKVRFTIKVSLQAPASFGLVTYLLHEGLDRARVRKHLLVFCLAAPSAAIATFLLLLSRSVSISLVIFSQSYLPVQGRLRGSRHYRRHGSGHALLRRDISIRGHRRSPWSQLRGLWRQASGRGLLQSRAGDADPGHGGSSVPFHH